jgi:hypothetical protein
VNRSALAFLALGLVLAVGACGRYGPPVRSFPAAAPAVEPAAPTAEAPGAGEAPANPGDNIGTFEDEPPK